MAAITEKLRNRIFGEMKLKGDMPRYNDLSINNPKLKLNYFIPFIFQHEEVMAKFLDSVDKNKSILLGTWGGKKIIIKFAQITKHEIEPRRKIFIYKTDTKWENSKVINIAAPVSSINYICTGEEIKNNDIKTQRIIELYPTLLYACYVEIIFEQIK